MHLLEILVYVSATSWAVLLILPWLPWRNREVLNASADITSDLDRVTVVIPARNESDVIQMTLRGLARQSHRLKVILVDDDSDDDTAPLASRTALTNLHIIEGKPLPSGWSGKLWAQHQGLSLVETPLVLLLDADIYLDDGILDALIAKKRKDNLHFVSLMASPGLHGFFERLLMPAFVYFFKLLYPFALSNSANPRFASAAGGCILVDTDVFTSIGGLQSIRGAIIDDCTLAKSVKSKGYRTWTGLSRNLHSQRPYAALADIWNMVARTAFTQLRYSKLLLALCTLIMSIMFILPLSAPFLSNPELFMVAGLSILFMLISYLPILYFYGLNPAWAFCLPLVSLLYLAMTWTSAWRYWNGESSRWKNRIYEREPQSEEA